MLIEFSVSNYLSIKDTVTFSMVASNSVKELEGDAGELNNVFYDESSGNKLIKSAVMYGANGSGKSNLLAAISFFKILFCLLLMIDKRKIKFQLSLSF